LSAMEKMQTQETAVQEKSPVELLMEQQEVNSEEELDITGGEALKLARKQLAWEGKQEATKSAATTEAERNQQLQVQFDAEIAKDHGEGLDYQTIRVELGGETLLTKGDLLDINESSDPYALVYARMIRAIKERGDDKTKQILQTRLDARKTKPDPKPEKPAEKVDDGSEEEEVSEDETKLEPISNPRLAALTQSAFVSQE